MDETTATFRVQTRYKTSFVVSLAIGALFGWSLLQDFNLVTAAFCIIALTRAGWFGSVLFNRVILTKRGVQLHGPFNSVKQVDYRQLSSVTEDGRLTRVLTLLYHPIRADGLLDLEKLLTLTLPAVEDQEELLAILDAAVQS